MVGGVIRGLCALGGVASGIDVDEVFLRVALSLSLSLSPVETMLLGKKWDSSYEEVLSDLELRNQFATQLNAPN